MKKIIIAALFLLSFPPLARQMQAQGGAVQPSFNIPAQYAGTVDGLAFYIDSHCDTDRKKLEAIYLWITTNLSYNVYVTFSSRNEVYSEERELSETLQTRRGVCRQFALLFSRIAEKMGIPAYVVSGYNKNAAGAVMSYPHDWCAAMADDRWLLYDPTYGMGYVKDNRFVRSVSMDYCHIRPEKHIVTHMPYDPMWQLLEHPYRYEEFDKGTFHADNRSPVFHYSDSIFAYEHLTLVQQLTKSYDRVANNGVSNPLTDYYMQLTQANLSVYRQKEVYDKYNQALKLQNQTCDLYSDFLRFKRQEFKPKKEDGEIRAMLTVAGNNVARAEKLMRSIREIPEQYARAVLGLQASIEETRQKVAKQQAFVEEYLKASASDRKKMLRN